MGGITTSTIINKVKYVGIFCLTLAILSTIGLNIISSYSNTKTISNAEEVSNDNTINSSTLANTDLSAISLSISSHSATGDSNNGNLSLQIPQGGGIVAGRHTVTVSAGSEIASYGVYLNGGNEEDNTDLVNTKADNLPNAGTLGTSIPSMKWNGDFSMPTGFSLHGNAWGVAIPKEYSTTYNSKQDYEDLVINPAPSSDGPRYNFSGIPPMSVGQEGGVNMVLYSPDSTRDIYYGVMVENPSAMLAGYYTAQVVYTVTAELKKPSISSVSPNPIRTNTAQRVTLTGSNLDIVSKVTIDDRNTIRDCTNISASTNGQSLICTLPALSNTGTYTITVETAGGQTAMVNLEVIPPVPSITSVSPNEVNVNNNTTVLTITGSNLATTSSVYIDFANIGTMDDGEECVIVPGSITDTQVKCTAPSRSVAFGPFPVGLITDGGDVSKSGAVSYVVQKPTITDNTVTPKMLIFAQTMGKSVSFTMKGTNLDAVASIRLYIDKVYSMGDRDNQECKVSRNDGSSIQCNVSRWIIWPYSPSSAGDVVPIYADLLSNTGEILQTVEDFCIILGPF